MEGPWSAGGSYEKCFDINKINVVEQVKVCEFPGNIHPIFDLGKIMEINDDEYEGEKIDKLQKILKNEYNICLYSAHFLHEMDDTDWYIKGMESY